MRDDDEARPSRSPATLPVNGNVVRLVANQVGQLPGNCAIREAISGKALTYRQLWDQSGRLAEQLAKTGICPGDVVGIGAGRSITLVTAILAIARTGAVYLPLDSAAPVDRQAALLADARVKALVTEPGSANWTALPANVRRVRPEVFQATFTEAASDFSDAQVDGGAPLYVNYTSGSTGLPKGVVVPHRAVERLVTGPKFCTIEPGDRVAHLSNPAFDATTFELWNTLTSGGTMVVLPTVTDLRLDDWLALLVGERITTMFLTTSLFHMVARERPAAFAALKTVVVGGEQMDLAATQRVLACGPPERLVNGYGPTETTTFAAYYDCAPESLAGLDRVPIGFALQDTRLYILDDQLRPVSPGENGELCIGGPGVALGYLGRPELTAERFVEEPGNPDAVVYRTGDLARKLPSGAVELVGRRDRQVKLRGFRIELEEIEYAILGSGLADSAFVEKAGDGPGAFLVAFVLPALSADVTSLQRKLTDHLDRVLPAYMVPARWFTVSELPYGPTGKIDRAALLGLLDEKPAAAGEDPAGDSAGEQFASIWRDVLGVSTAGPTDNFFDAGGNSILAVQFVSRVRERLAVDLEPVDVLLTPSFADLASRVVQHVPATS